MEIHRKPSGPRLSLSASASRQSRKCNRRQINLLDLPPDVVLCILGRVAAEDLCRLALCCKELLEYANNEELWHPLLNSKWGKFFSGDLPSSCAKKMLHSTVAAMDSAESLMAPCHLPNACTLGAISRESNSSQALVPIVEESFSSTADRDSSARSKADPFSCSPALLSFQLDQEITTLPSAEACNVMKLECSASNCSWHCAQGSFIPQLGTCKLPIEAPAVSSTPCSPGRRPSSWQMYKALETGQLEFPVQIFNCEQYLGSLLSAYDARARCTGSRKVSSGKAKKAFEVRYAGPMYHEILEAPLLLQETDVEWERLRAAPLPMAPCQLYEGKDIMHLKVGDFVEMQWRVHDEMPYTWLFGQVRHYLLCPNGVSLDVPVPPCPSCVCNQMRRVCITFRKFGFNYVERSLFIDKEMPGDHRMAQGVGFGGGIFGGLRIVRDPREVEEWLTYGRTQRSLHDPSPPHQPLLASISV